MKFDTPATTNPIDQLKVVGKHDRIDGPLKTTGTAPYAYEQHQAVANQAYGFMVGAAIAKGRISHIDLDAAKPRRACWPSSPPPMPASSAKANTMRRRCSAGPRCSTTIRRWRWWSPRPSSRPRRRATGQGRLRRGQGEFDLANVRDQGVEDDELPDVTHGDFDSAFAAAPVQLDQTYTTPINPTR
jgi:xanthine dehydrogenase YagR molybdenum-binding subunit